MDALTESLLTEAGDLPRPLVVAIAREALESARSRLSDGESADPLDDGTSAVQLLSRRKPSVVINATGVLLHTNLGRAPLAATAAKAADEQSVGYSNLEFDLAAGSRGGRGAYVHELVTTLTGAEGAMVVNNTAGALLLTLATLATGEAVVVSRGELIEIGGSFRLPDLMAASGATMREVGTTNRTRLADYRAAIEGAKALLKVHTSNYRIEGFTEEVGYRELADLAQSNDVPFVADVGSGLLDTRVPWLAGGPPAWLADEPGVRQTLEVGADLVLFSGDKLLGGPQAGIAVGKRDLVDRLARHPMARALRIDGPSLAALAATLELYADGRGAEIPFWHMASLDTADLEARHKAVLASAGVDGEVVEGVSVAGAGSVPGSGMPSPVIRIPGKGDDLWRGLLDWNPPVVARRRDDAVWLDLRTVAEGDDEVVARALAKLAA